MRAVKEVAGRAIVLDRDNIDTDLIIPADYMKTISRAGLGSHAFEVLRAHPGNPFDEAAGDCSPILIAGANFGCGSSREHAAWALADFGIQAIIATSFADLFSGNAYRNGILTVALERPRVERLIQHAATGRFKISIEQMTVSAGDLQFAFDLDPVRRECLMNGVDEIASTLRSEPAIRAFEERPSSWPV